MAVAQQILVLVHLIGFAALLGGCLVQLRTPEPEVSTAMLWGAVIELVTGVALFIVVEVAVEPVRTAPLVVKTLLTAFLMTLVAVNRRYAAIPRGLWALITGLSLTSAATSVLWT